MYTVESQEGAPMKVRIAGLNEQSLRSLREVFAPDGIELHVVESRKYVDLARRAREERGLPEFDGAQD